MPESATLQRQARYVTACLILSAVLPVAPVVWDFRVNSSVGNLQAAKDRLDALRERLDEPQSSAGASLALAEDVLLRRSVHELMADIHLELAWCDQVDLSGLQRDFDAWFSNRATPDPFMRLDGVIDAAVYRSRAAADQTHWFVVGGCLAGIASAIFGWLALRRLVQIQQVQLVPPVRIAVPVIPSRVASKVPTSTSAEAPIRMPLPPTLTPPVFRPIASADLAPSPGLGLPAVAPGPLSRLHGRVLVIEDNPINQRVTQRQLMELGLGVEVVATAELGLARLVHREFDAVLMDLQLPGIDGLTATRRWRIQEAAEGRRRLPIIAITANAMGTDREACYSAGMDGYQAKPARLDDLHRVLVRWVPSAPATKPTADEAAALFSSPSPSPLAKEAPESTPRMAASMPPNPSLTMLLSTARDADLADPHLWSKLRSETANTDPRLLEELLMDLREQSVATLGELEDALNVTDHERLRAGAHKLKGSAGMLGLPRLSACAKVLEYAAKAQDATIAAQAFALLRETYALTMAEPQVLALQ